MDKRTLRSRKGKPRNARPYDHQNQSIFGKVYSTVRGWLSTVPQWISNSDQEQLEGSSDEVEEDTVREDNDIVSHSLSHGNKRLRLRKEDNPVPAIQNSGTQTWHEQPTENLFETISLAQSSETQTSLLDNKEALTVLNGDDHSENSEGSASTSGCSSLVSSHKESNRLPGSTFANLLETKNRKRKEPSKCDYSDFNSSKGLWSSSISSPKFPSSPRRPTVSHTNQPSFKLSSFGGPSKLNESVEKTSSSPFYEGRTTFGGASAFRRMPPSVTPYNVDKTLRNQIKTRDQNLEDNLEGMSSAAKRILLTLEKMSTPVADAKKIPNSDRSPVDLSLYLTPPKSRRNSQFTPSVASKGPPIANINTIAKFTSLKNFGASRLQNTLQSSPVTSVAQKTPRSEYAQPNTSETPSFKSGGGKIKVKLNQQHQPSRAANADNELGYELPSLKSVPLQMSSLPSINFGAKQEKPPSLPVGGFTFSNPIQHELSINSAVPASTQSSLTYDSFKFSSPIEHELPTTNKTQPKEKSLQSWDSECWTRKPKNESTSKICDAPTVSKEKNTTKSTLTPAMGKMNMAGKETWECSSCWVRNPVNECKCMACETPKSTGDKKSAKPSISISTPTSTPSLAKAKTTLAVKETWECSSCWVRNPVNESKCMACETPKNTEDKKSASKLEVKSAFSTWECTSCWVRNPVSEKKCMACETLHPSADEKPGFTFKGANKFGTTAPSAPLSSAAASFGSFVFSTASTEAQNTAPASTAVGSGSGFSFKGLSKPETTAVSSAAPQSTPSGPNPSTTTTASSVLPAGFGFASTKAETQTTTPASFSFGSGSGFTFKGLNKPESNVAVSSAASQSTISGSNLGSSTPTPSGGFVFATSNTETQNTTPAPSLVASSDFTFKSQKNPEATVVSSAVSQPGPILSTSATGGLFASATTKTDTLTTPAPFPFGSGSVTSTPSSTSEKVSSAKGSWECSSCWVRNPETETKCMACETAKTTEVPAPAPLKVTSSKDTWECSSCWVKNPLKESKCLACETPKNTEDKKSGFTIKADTVSTLSSAVSLSTQSNPLLSSSTPALSGNFVFAAPKSDSQMAASASLAVGSGFSFKGLSKPDTTAVSSAASQSTPSGPNPSTTTTASSVLPAGFGFASTKAETQTTTPASFSFGSGSGFTFKGVSKPKTTSVLSSSASPLTTTGPSLSSSAAAMPTGGFVFTTPKTETQNTAPAPFAVGSGSGFTFKGLNKAETTPASSVTSQSMTSGPILSTSAANTPGGFVFTTPKTETQTTAPAPFSFGSGSGFAFKTENPQVTPAVSSTSQPAATSSAPLPSGGFVFRAAKSEAASATPASFTFGSGMSSNAPAFSVNNSVAPSFQATDKPAAGGFNFRATSSPVFQFGAANNPSVSSATGLAPQPSGGFVFGAPKTEAPSAIPASFTFGSGMAMPSSTSVLSGNNPVAPSFESGADKPAGGGFNFGVGAPSVFQFGSSNNNNAEKKRAAGFSFGTPAAQEVSNSFPQGFNMSTPPSFNFGASSTPAAGGPFQFAASTAPNSAPSQSGPRKYKKGVRRMGRRD